MIQIPHGVKVIESYPFRIENLVIETLGKSTDWKLVLANLQDADTYELLASHVHGLGGRRIVCPKPVHKADISSSKELKILTVSRDQIAIYRGKEADGAEIEPEEVYALASGDCPTVALSDPETQKVVAMHFNRENGIDNNILGMALRGFSEGTRNRMVATISLGIGPTHFTHPHSHPEYGKSNRERTKRLIEQYGREAVGSLRSMGQINLRWVATKKLIDAGIPRENIYVDLVDTYEDERFWSHRASQDSDSGKFGDKGRNMVLVGNISQERLS